MQSEARHQHARNAEARGEPAAAEIGEDARRLIKQEEERQHERRVAKAIEMQQHQHAQGAVRQRETPITRGHVRLITHAGHLSSRHQALLLMTMLARSTMRQA